MFDEPVDPDEKIQETMLQATTFGLLLSVAKQAGLTYDEIQETIDSSIDACSAHMMAAMQESVESMDDGEKLLCKFLSVDHGEQINNIKVIGDRMKVKMGEMFNTLKDQENG